MRSINVSKLRLGQEVMYLTVLMKAIEPDIKAWTTRPTEKFQEMVNELVMAYVIDEKEPPQQIQTAIMNLSDDLMSDRNMVMRSGDYIALQNYFREGTKR